MIIAGTWASVCMVFPAINAVAEGYKVYSVLDASGTISKMASDITLARIVQAGAIPIDTMALIAEIQRTWNRPDAGEFTALYAERVEHYSLLMESFQTAQAVGEQEASKKLVMK